MVPPDEPDPEIHFPSGFQRKPFHPGGWRERRIWSIATNLHWPRPHLLGSEGSTID